MKNNKYGYKVYCIEKNSKKKKLFLVTNSYDLAKWEIEYYIIHPQYDRKTKQLLNNPIWIIKEIKTYLEYKYLWRGCPF